MHGVEQTLAQMVVKHLAQQLELGVGVAEAVAVCEEEHLVAYLCGERTGVYRHAALLLKVAVCPDVVVAGEEVYLHSHVGELGYLA